MFGDHEPQHGIAEELESFVRLSAGVLRAPGAVRDRRQQQVGIDRSDRGGERSSKSGGALTIVGQAASIFAVT
jgi:hypothetical protein